MSSTDEITARATLDTSRQKPILHLATCGSVDDGKSTLIGRLLVDSRVVLDDQLAHVADASKRRGLDAPDLALLTDGLRAEREQGITIDVAYRTFATKERRFSLADSPGHVQYTCNMAVAASGADVAIVLLEAEKGVVAQTRRHLLLSRLVGVSTFVVAVNKMDAIGYSQARFAEVRDRVGETFAALTALLPGPAPRLEVLPISALLGDNVVTASPKLAWYDGHTLLGLLERLPGAAKDTDGPARLPVQWVSRPALASGDKRSYAGRVARGTFREGDEVVVLPSGKTSRVHALRSLRRPNGTSQVVHGESVTLVLEDEIDVARGDVISLRSRAPRVESAVSADVVWLSKRALGAGTRVLVKQGTRLTQGRITALEHVYDLDHAEARPAPSTLGQNDVARITLETATPLVFDPFAESRGFGSVLVIEPTSGEPLAAGALR
jgi:sulfate adenylyltransferase subunit 1